DGTSVGPEADGGWNAGPALQQPAGAGRSGGGGPGDRPAPRVRGRCASGSGARLPRGRGALQRVAGGSSGEPAHRLGPGGDRGDRRRVPASTRATRSATEPSFTRLNREWTPARGAQGRAAGASVRRGSPVRRGRRGRGAECGGEESHTPATISRNPDADRRASNSGSTAAKTIQLNRSS